MLACHNLFCRGFLTTVRTAGDYCIHRSKERWVAMVKRCTTHDAQWIRQHKHAHNARLISPGTVSEFMSTRISGILFEESSDAASPEGKVMYRSGCARTMFGRSGAEAVARSVEKIIVAPDRMAEEPGTGSAACRRNVSSEMAGVIPLPGFPQLTQSGRRLVRVPPLATAGFCRTHLPTSVLPENRHLVFSPVSRCAVRSGVIRLIIQPASGIHPVQNSSC